MAGLGAVDGGYFPGDWGLATLAFTLVAASAILIADLPRPGRLELAFLGGIAALALWALLSTAWSPGATAQVSEAERGLLYVAAATAAILLLSFREAFASLLGGILAGAVAVALYALGTRLFPGDVGGAYDPSSGYQLAEPLGYWNALGILTVLALLLAGALAAHGVGLATRVLASASLVVLLPTLYFTFSRGALVALVVGAIVQIAADTHRARLLATGLVVGTPALLAVYLASRYHALTTAGDSLTTAQREGHELAKILLALMLLAAAAAVAMHIAERRLRFSAHAGRLLVGAVTAAALLAALGALAAAGGPVDVVRRASDSFGRAPAPGDGDLQRRLVSASGNGRSDYWRVARTMVRDEPLLGTGAGSFEAHWFRERSVAFHARDAHNLYLETLAELGPVGLALLLASLALPLVALPAVRGFAYAPAAVGAYAAYLVHAGVDWDWEVPAVTVPAIFCAAVLLARGSARRTAVADRQAARDHPRTARPARGGRVRRAASATGPRRRASWPRRRETRPAALPRRSGRSAGHPGRKRRGSCGARPSSSSATLRPPGAAWRAPSTATPRAGASGSTWRWRALRANASWPSSERPPSIRSAPRSTNSEQNLNECTRRGSRPSASTHQRNDFRQLMKGAQLSNPKKRSRIAGAAAMVVCLLAALAALGGVGAAQSAISSADKAYGKKVTICHKGKNTISIAKAAWPAHQRHGDTLGTCAAAQGQEGQGGEGRQGEGRRRQGRGRQGQGREGQGREG